jgi:hypothetical protein
MLNVASRTSADENDLYVVAQRAEHRQQVKNTPAQARAPSLDLEQQIPAVVSGSHVVGQREFQPGAEGADKRQAARDQAMPPRLARVAQRRTRTSRATRSRPRLTETQFSQQLMGVCRQTLARPVSSGQRPSASSTPRTSGKREQSPAHTCRSSREISAPNETDDLIRAAETSSEDPGSAELADGVFQMR